MRKHLILGCLCSCMMLPAIAKAGEKITTANVNLRSGAGVGYLRVATLPRGRLVRVTTCRRDWCQVSVEDLNGWVSLRYLADPPGITPYYPQTVAPPPPVEFEPVVPRNHAGPRNYHDFDHLRPHQPRRRFHH